LSICHDLTLISIIIEDTAAPLHMERGAGDPNNRNDDGVRWSESGKCHLEIFFE
jgi:hypothetical protein